MQYPVLPSAILSVIYRYVLGCVPFTLNSKPTPGGHEFY